MHGSTAKVSINAASGSFHPDFYVVTATVIPVIFLALVLEGGLWAWITTQINAGNLDTLPARLFVTLLQLLATIIVGAAVMSEILALDDLWRRHNNETHETIIFYSTALLVIALGVLLAAKIPGLITIGPASVNLQLEDDNETLLWSGRCARMMNLILPWAWGSLYVTDKRFVWTASTEAGLGAASKIELRPDEIVTIKGRVTALTRILPGRSLPPFLPPRCILTITIEGGINYRFAAEAKRDEIIRALELLRLPR
jgi:hypothetical protein